MSSVYAQEVNDTVEVSDSVLLRITSDNITQISSEIDNLEIQNEELLAIIKSLKTEIQSLDKNLLLHEQWSGGLTYLGIIIGTIIGISGWIIGMAQLIPNLNERKVELKKREKIKNQLKENLAEILDLSKVLEKISPNMEELSHLRIWKLIRLRTNVISTIITGGMTFLDMKLIRYTLEYLNNMNDRFDITDKKHKVSYIFLVKHTKFFLDKFFPEHEEEKIAFLKYLDEQGKMMEELQEKEMLEWYEKHYDPELYQDDEESSSNNEKSKEDSTS